MRNTVSNSDVKPPYVLIREAISLSGISESTIRREEKAGRFPPIIKLSVRMKKLCSVKGIKGAELSIQRCINDASCSFFLLLLNNYWTMNWLFPEYRPHKQSLQVRKKRFDSCKGRLKNKFKFVLPLKSDSLVFKLKPNIFWFIR